MLAESTIKREMRRLRKIIDEYHPSDKPNSDPLVAEAYGAECALLWALGGCDWTPSDEVFWGWE